MASVTVAGAGPAASGVNAQSRKMRKQILNPGVKPRNPVAVRGSLKLINRLILAACGAILVGMLFMSSTEMARRRQTGHVALGVWGGQHVRMEVKKDSAELEYDCAHGTIDQPVVLDRRGRFDLLGTHVHEHGGPIRRDEKPNAHAARYTGWTDGKRMTLSVKLSDTNEEIGTFTLTRGSEGRVFKCR